MSVHAQVPVADGTPPRIEVRNPAGSVTVEARRGRRAARGRVEPLDDAAEQLLDRVEARRVGRRRSRFPDRLRVAVPERRLLRTPAFAVRSPPPRRPAARIAVASADVELTGRLGALELTGASGDLDVERRHRRRTLRTASGDVRIGTVDGHGSIGSASGDVRVGRRAAAR